MRHLIVEVPPKLVFPDRLTRLIAREPTDADDSKLESKESFWWDGLQIVPPRPKLGLLSELVACDTNEDQGDLEEESEEETRSDTSTSGTTTSESEESGPTKHKVGLYKDIPSMF